MQPAIFAAHGSPMLALEENAYTRALRSLGERYRPRAVIVFTAHWESNIQAISDVAAYETIHDFGGFPQELYRMRYPARGDAATAVRAAELLTEAGIPFVWDRRRGLDHGAWVPLRLIYPDGSVPVVQMSVNPWASPAEQYRIGQALAPLRREDVMILASGGTIHNFATLRWDDPPEADAWAVAFDDWLLGRIREWDLPALFDYERQAPGARLAVPPGGNEHFVPLFYALGAADDQRTVQELHRSYRYGNLSHALWAFGG